MSSRGSRGASSANSRGGGEEDDWLGSYLATTRYASDPRLNAAPSSAAEVAANRKARKPQKGKTGDTKGGQHADDTGGYNLSAAPPQRPGASKSDRRRSWAATSSISRVRGAFVSPAAVAAAPAAEEQQDNVQQQLEQQQRQLLSAATAAAGAAVAAAAAADGARGKDGEEKSDNLSWEQELGERATNMRRKSFSGSGRRISLDYSDLEAVKERVTQATSLWAVTEEHERDSMSSNGSRRPSASAVAVAAAAATTAAAAHSGVPAGGVGGGPSSLAASSSMHRRGPSGSGREIGLAAIAARGGRGRGGGEDDDEEEEEEEPKVLPQRSVPEQDALVTTAAAKSKKVSLIKKWLIFRK